jgi:hypothetical protein
MAQSGHCHCAERCPLLGGVKRTFNQTWTTACSRLARFSFKRACDSSVPRLDGAFCSVGVAINDLKVWQAPKVEQLRPTQILMFAPYSKKRNTVIDLSIRVA